MENQRGPDQAPIARRFDRTAAQSDTEPIDLPMPVPISARLSDLLADIGHVHPSVLDLGCGTGAGAIRLIQSGARSVTGIDLSPASIDVARRRAMNAGLAPDQTRFLPGDVASDYLPPHDWVLLDRVICCYHDPDRLVANAIAAASSRLAFSVPESRGWRGAVNAVGWMVKNLWMAIVHPDDCRGQVHDVKTIEKHVGAAGFRKVGTAHSGLWYAAVFER